MDSASPRQNASDPSSDRSSETHAVGAAPHQLGAGRPAHFVLWPVAEAAELAYWLGHKPACTIVRQGRVVRDALGIHG